MPHRISIVLPAYNEEKNISATVASIAEFFAEKQEPYEIIVVDDGSSDATAKLTTDITRANPFVSVMFHQKNCGKGVAVKTGVLAAKGDIIAFLDADGSTPVREIEKCLPFFLDGFDVIIGSRYMNTDSIIIKQHWFRVMMGRIGNLLIQFVLLPGIIDTQCGCKLFTRKAALQIFSRQKINRWGFDMESLAIARYLGFKIKEVPVNWYDTLNRKSRFRPLKDMGRTLCELIIIKWNFLRGRYR